ncbi:unnamed protein product [Paramecium sonneborni]|uniref:Uncharacterized protein n=1 Tax=Paramecium sonneborni TaxID=65129 RepID=A0A8S1RQH0_9CILI|nr:unnamed protein product [Paramecium sonneborni]
MFKHIVTEAIELESIDIQLQRSYILRDGKQRLGICGLQY